MMGQCAILIASDTRSQGENTDLAGPAAERAMEKLGISVLATVVVPDEMAAIEQQLIDWCTRDDIALILTSGGTGLTPRDVTPEATKAVIEKEVPGIAEMLRSKSMTITPHAALSRAVAGIRNRTLIVNLPGSPKAVTESVEFLAPILPHALETVTGNAAECAQLRQKDSKS